ncbi:DUF443 family protein [Salipaludibacillus agaradhaerens]|uniref:DUF443 domain-containing protein n=1 Tax=Salipaludibacillus agaradhaerens TaxID=76935 RepID=UPI002150A0CA|nr:DUF443 domain-containing protein [Salipaludibacillus agaradhaerens]MCR6105706.1 DUF443 family protein [Salipaludibacillus agaradhaerens]MCR6117742.1 DUF443 family protein [Salipaludibacillus agaradhaerens]
MPSEIKRIKKNLTYRIVTIDGEHYLMDTGTPFWKGLFPYSYWLFSHPAYKLQDDKVLGELDEIHDDRGEVVALGSAGAGGSIFLRPFVDFFDIPTSAMINSIILIIALAITLSIRLYYSKRTKEKINKKIAVEKLKTEQLVIRPSSIAYFLQFSMFYVFFLGMGVMSIGGFVVYGNMLLLIGAMFYFFFMLMFNSTSVIPDKTYGKLANRS